ncbi:MAG: hypothetical protein IT445_05995 [Phycisphaeraceae bacterium]|nr:hypothetical protein [Phycisphaeraceae bacterium]
MAIEIQRVSYFYATVKDQPGEGYRILDLFAKAGVSLLAFNAVPVGPMRTQLMLFPKDAARFQHAAKSAALDLEGPHPALLVQGDDEIGALIDVHERLFEARVNVYSTNGVTDGKGRFGYVIYIRPEDFNRAAEVLDVA